MNRPRRKYTIVRLALCGALFGGVAIVFLFIYQSWCSSLIVFSPVVQQRREEARQIARRLSVLDDDLDEAIRRVKKEEGLRIKRQDWFEVPFEGTEIERFQRHPIVYSKLIGGCGRYVVYSDYRIAWEVIE